MTITSTSFSINKSCQDPKDWLESLGFYTGVLEALARDHRVTSIEHINYTGIIKKNGVEYIFIEEQLARLPLNTFNQLKRDKPELILINGFDHPIQLLQLRFALGKNPLIFVWNRAEKPFTGIKARLQKWADRYISAYLFSAKEDGASWLKNKIISDKQKIKEVSSASSTFSKIEKGPARKRLGLGEDRIYLWVGRLDQNKDPLTPVKAFLQYAEHFNGAKFYMIFQDDPLLGELKNLVLNSYQKDKIIFIGKVIHRDLENWYSAADFIISGSHSESNGIAVLEAMSCGCIPILTRIPAFTRMTNDGAIGFLYEAGNHDELFNVLTHTNNLDVDDACRKVSERFENEFSFAAITEKLNELIKNHGRKE